MRARSASASNDGSQTRAATAAGRRWSSCRRPTPEPSAPRSRSSDASARSMRRELTRARSRRIPCPCPRCRPSPSSRARGSRASATSGQHALGRLARGFDAGLGRLASARPELPGPRRPQRAPAARAPRAHASAIGRLRPAPAGRNAPRDIATARSPAAVRLDVTRIEHRPGRRLLERLQQRVLRGIAEALGFVEDDHAAARLERPERRLARSRRGRPRS